MVFHQHEGKRAWLGPVKVFAVNGNSICIFTNGRIWKAARYLKPKEREKIKKEDLTTSNALKTSRSCVQESPPETEKSSHWTFIRGCGDSFKEKKKDVIKNKHKVEFEGDFGEKINEENVEEIGRRQT